MRLLIDQDVYAATTRFLKSLGHDAVTAAELGLASAADETLLSVAGEQKRILVTRDRDYGALVFLRSIGAGVLYLRVLPSTQDAVHAELAKVLGQYSEQELAMAFVVIEPAGHRIRRLHEPAQDAKSPGPST
jgi:predicted nuclease of predicted toxin-antitoxin system